MTTIFRWIGGFIVAVMAGAILSGHTDWAAAKANTAWDNTFGFSLAVGDHIVKPDTGRGPVAEDGPATGATGHVSLVKPDGSIATPSEVFGR